MNDVFFSTTTIMSNIEVSYNVVYSPKTKGFLCREIGENSWETFRYGAFMSEPIGTRRVVRNQFMAHQQGGVEGFHYKYVITRTPTGVQRTTYMYQHDEVSPDSA